MSVIPNVRRAVGEKDTVRTDREAARSWVGAALRCIAVVVLASGTVVVHVQRFEALCRQTEAYNAVRRGMSRASVHQILSPASGWRASARRVGLKSAAGHEGVEMFWLGGILVPMFTIEVHYDGDVVAEKLVFKRDRIIDARELPENLRPFGLVMAAVFGVIAVVACLFVAAIRRGAIADTGPDARGFTFQCDARLWDLVMLLANGALLLLLLFGLFASVVG